MEVEDMLEGLLALLNPILSLIGSVVSPITGLIF